MSLWFASLSPIFIPIFVIVMGAGPDPETSSGALQPFREGPGPFDSNNAKGEIKPTGQFCTLFDLNLRSRKSKLQLMFTTKSSTC
jgi:hypothetical protein